MAITGAATNGATVNIVTVTITDDDALTVGVNADAGTVVEGNDAAFTVSVAGCASTADVVMPYYTVGATATYGANYAARSGTLTVPPSAPSYASRTSTTSAPRATAGLGARRLRAGGVSTGARP